jgi:hypothetical protein
MALPLPVPFLPTLGLGLCLGVMAGHAQRLHVLVMVKATFGQWHDVVADGGWPVASTHKADYTERLLLEQLCP